MRLAIALSGLGSHPAAAIADRGTDPQTLAGAARWTALLASIDRDELAFATIADGPEAALGRPDAPRLPWLDAAMIACRVAPRTARIGLVAQIPTVTTDPFLVSTQVATLDHVSGGRGGWEPHISLDPETARQVGPRAVPPPEERFAEAAEHIEVVRRLWDSWDDDAEIRDAATHRFVDRGRLHPIRYEGRYLSVIGPSITPRPPQGQPLIALAAGDETRTALAGAHGDVVFVDAAPARIAIAIDRIASAAAVAGRERAELRVLADLRVVLDHDAGRAAARLAHLEDAVPAGWPRDDAVLAGTPADLAEWMLELQRAGADGVRLHPAVLADDLPPIVSALTGALAPGDKPLPTGGTLRHRLGLERPSGRHPAVA